MGFEDWTSRVIWQLKCLPGTCWFNSIHLAGSVLTLMLLILNGLNFIIALLKMQWKVTLVSEKNPGQSQMVGSRCGPLPSRLCDFEQVTQSLSFRIRTIIVIALCTPLDCWEAQKRYWKRKQYIVWLTGQVYSGTVVMPHGVKRDLLVPSVAWNENHLSGKTENYCNWWIPFSPCLPAPSSCSLFALTKVQTIFFTMRDGGQLLSWVGLLFTGFLWILYSLPPNITLSSRFLLALNIASNTFELPWWLRQ